MGSSEITGTNAVWQ